MSDPTQRPMYGAGLIRQLPTGVQGLDAVLGGGIPEFSFNLLAGGPGAGKTTLAQQLMFANASVQRPGLYFTVLGEPTLKMMRYQQQYRFFEPARVGRDIHLLNLGTEAAAGDLDAVLGRIVSDVERLKPSIVVVDSFRTIGPQARIADVVAMAALEGFVQRLALHLTSWETTSFLISEYESDEQRHPIFTVADGIVWLSQVPDRNSVVRKLQVVKVRGQGFMPGLHTFRITDSGLQVFPRIPEQQSKRKAAPARRLGTGVQGLDALLGGGLPAGDAVLLAGPTGAGKSTIATQFVHEGGKAGEPAVIAVFEEYPERYLARAKSLGIDLSAMIDAGQLRIVYLRPLDLSVDETLAEIVTVVQELNAQRVVIDSLSGFEVALAPTFRQDFRESLYRLVGALTAVGVTVFMTTEVARPENATSRLSFTGAGVSFLADDILVQRYIELEGQLRTVLAVVKMRGSAHSRDFHEYTLTERGVVMGSSLREYDQILTGFPTPRARRAAVRARSGLTSRESVVLDELMVLGDAGAELLAERTATAADAMRAILDRLMALGYAQRVEADEHRTVYRVTARATMP